MYRDIIDIESSKFKTNRKLTNPRVINQLYTRTPHLYRIVLKHLVMLYENILLSSESTFQNRQCNNLAGITIDDFYIYTDTQHIHNQNPTYIPEDSHSDWVRGGIDTRQIIRQQNYHKCN